VAKAFIEDLKKDFTTLYSQTPLRVETKQFLSGEGASMEEAIRTILNTDYGYARDGLIFTPKESGVAPIRDTMGNTWTRVYKWKPAEKEGRRREGGRKRREGSHQQEQE
jgi:hypothetical protein